MKGFQKSGYFSLSQTAQIDFHFQNLAQLTGAQARFRAAQPFYLIWYSICSLTQIMIPEITDLTQEHHQ